MPTGTANTAEEITDNIRALVDRLVESKVTHEMTRRGQDVASLIADRGNEAWRDSRPMRRDASKRLARASRDMATWANRTWRKDVRPTLRDVWKRREVAIGAAGAAVPAAGEIVDTAAARLGLKQREERHWGAFFFGLLIGLAAGAVVALLTAPKRGDEMRRELTERADEIATRAKDEWVPMFQRDETNGQRIEASTATIAEGAADAGPASGPDVERAADETAEAINEAFESGAGREKAEGEPSA